MVYKTLSMVSNAAGSLLGDKTQNLNARYVTKEKCRTEVVRHWSLEDSEDHAKQISHKVQLDS